MKTCKDCLHFDVCLSYTDPDESFYEVGGCQLFKNKNDFVPVVRCKDCVLWDNGDCYRIELTRPDDFCSYGVRNDK